MGLYEGGMGLAEMSKI